MFCLFIGHCDSHKIISSHSHEDILEENETIDDEFWPLEDFPMKLKQGQGALNGRGTFSTPLHVHR